MATRAELRDKVARKLGKKAIGQALPNPLANDLDDAYDEIYETLNVLDLVSWTLDGDIPDEFVFPVVALVALSRVTEYGITGNRLAGIVSAAGSSKPRIRELLSAPYFDSAEGAVYY